MSFLSDLWDKMKANSAENNETWDAMEGLSNTEKVEFLRRQEASRLDLEGTTDLSVVKDLHLYKSQLHPKLYEALRELNKGESGKAGRFINFAEWYKHHVCKVDDGQANYIRIVQGYRSPGEQKALYVNGYGTYTKAPPYQSYHQWGCAVDLVFRTWGYDNYLVKADIPGVRPEKRYFTNKNVWLWTGLPQYMESVGIEWGGRWIDLNDCGHFQLAIKVPKSNDWSGQAWWMESIFDLRKLIIPKETIEGKKKDLKDYLPILIAFIVVRYYANNKNKVKRMIRNYTKWLKG